MCACGCTGLTYVYVLAGKGRARSIHRLRPKTALSPYHDGGLDGVGDRAV